MGINSIRLFGIQRVLIMADKVRHNGNRDQRAVLMALE